MGWRVEGVGCGVEGVGCGEDVALGKVLARVRTARLLARLCRIPDGKADIRLRVYQPVFEMWYQKIHS